MHAHAFTNHTTQRPRVMLRDTEAVPPLPSDSTGRPLNWVFVTSTPGFTFGGKDYELDHSRINYLRAEMERLMEGGYEIPVIAEHDPAVTAGRRLGDVVALETMALSGELALIAAVRWALEDAPERIQRGEIRYFSPGFSALENAAIGEADFPFVMSELSVVAGPAQKGKRTHILAKEQITMADEKQAEAAPSLDEQVAALAGGLASLTEQVANLAESIAPLLSQDNPKEDDEEEDVSPAMAEVKLLRSKLDELESQRDRVIFTTGIPSGASVTLSESMLELLFPVWRQDREAFEAALQGAVNVPAEQPAAPPAPVMPRNPFAVQLGQSGADAQPVAQQTRGDLYAECLAECDGDATAAMNLYKQRKYGA